MSNNTAKLFEIIKNTSKCTDECSGCQKKCEYKAIAKALADAGAIIPVLCKECTLFDPDLGICKIRHDSYGSVMERGPHDWCSDATRKEN